MTGGCHAFRYSGSERDYIVPDGAFNLLDSGDLKTSVLPQELRGFRGHFARFRESFGSGQLYFQPRTVLAFFAPDTAHSGQRVALNHLIGENLGLLFRLGDNKSREKRAAGFIERAASRGSHDFRMIIVLAQMSQH